jgi:GNAT superfamily N-acetyltransferase
MNLQIQKACKSDLTSILNLYAESDIDNGKKLDLTAAEKLFDKILSYPNFNVYVALSNDKIIGTFELLIMDNLAHMGLPSAIVEDVVVHSDYRGQGVGKKMMQFAFEKCKKAGCYKMVLSSNIRRDRAHHFYESLGFEKHGYSFQINF